MPKYLSYLHSETQANKSPSLNPHFLWKYPLSSPKCRPLSGGLPFTISTACALPILLHSTSIYKLHQSQYPTFLPQRSWHLHGLWKSISLFLNSYLPPPTQMFIFQAHVLFCFSCFPGPSQQLISFKYHTCWISCPAHSLRDNLFHFWTYPQGQPTSPGDGFKTSAHCHYSHQKVL